MFSLSNWKPESREILTLGTTNTDGTTSPEQLSNLLLLWGLCLCVLVDQSKQGLLHTPAQFEGLGSRQN